MRAPLETGIVRAHGQSGIGLSSVEADGHTALFFTLFIESDEKKSFNFVLINRVIYDDVVIIII